MAADEPDAWWDTLPDHIEDWDGPPAVPKSAEGNTGRRRSSSGKASLQAILMKADHLSTAPSSYGDAKTAPNRALRTLRLGAPAE
jgi:hypothetical protein